MKKLKQIILLLTVLYSNAGFGKTTDHLLWMQQPSISPNGQWIAFEYKGNLYKVSAQGGNAVPLTANSWYNGYPKWSHDGTQIAFASNRYGNFDVFTMSATGGNATRLTYASTRDIPTDFSNDDKQVYYLTNAPDVYTSIRFPDDDNLWMKLYSVPVQGGRSHMVNSAGTEFASFNRTGDKLLFQDRKGWENPYRKHHISPVTRDIWCYDLKLKSYTRLSDFDGEDREPVWGEGDQFFYLSERNGSQNIFTATLDAPAKVSQLTTFEKNPVRNLSRSDNGLLAFTQDGEFFTLKEGGTPQKLVVTFATDFGDEDVNSVAVKNAGDEMALSPNGKEIAFTFQGDIFVSATSGNFTKQITNSPLQKRMVSFSPDGRTLLYSVENAGSWDIFKAIIADQTEPYFYSSAKIDIQPVIATPKDEFQAAFSPDGKHIAYLEERNILRVYDVFTKKTTTLIPEGDNYSYSDGDLTFCWSPDSKYIAMQSENGLLGRLDIDLVKADGSEKRTNVTRSAYPSFTPHWGKSGKMMYYFSAKDGPGGGLRDVFALFFDHGAYKNYTNIDTNPQLTQERKQLDSVSGHSLSKVNSTENQKSFVPDLQHLEDRLVKLTTVSSQIGDAVLSPDEGKLYSLSVLGNTPGIYTIDQRTHEQVLLAKLNSASGKLALSPDGKFIYLLSGGQISKISTDDGSNSPVSINSSQILNKGEQRAYIFNHVYHILAKKFYDPHLRGVDWDYYYQEYSRFLDHISNNYDFEVLLSEFIGELNSSHSGATFVAPRKDGDQTASLGLLYDLNAATNGLKVTAILNNGPFDLSHTDLKTGDIIDEIDGSPLKATEDWAKLLNLKAGKSIQVSFHDPVTKKNFKEFVAPVTTGEETELRYKHWVRQMENLTDSLSHGTIVYVHIREMSEASLRATYEAAVGRGIGKKAVILDTRYNTGGNIHEELMTLVSPNTSALFDRPQSVRLADEGTTGGLDKPTCVIVSEGNYSDGFNFPYLYQLHHAGKLVGMPVAGTGTGIWFENEVDKSLYIGIPAVGLSLPGANQPLLENHRIDPDIRIHNDYEQILNGHDQQLEAAVRELMSQVKN